MPKATSVKTGSESTREGTWIARDSKSGRFVEIKRASRQPAGTVVEESPMANSKRERRPGRLKGKLTVGSEFFEPLSESDLAALGGA